MKRMIWLFAIGFLILLSSCQDPHKKFCHQAVNTLCTKCEQCGGDYKMCGLNKTTSKADCITTLSNVCSAYDGVFKQEVSSTCLMQLNQISCEQLRDSGKPEMCTRLF